MALTVYVLHVAAALAVVLTTAVLGRMTARLLRQPEVIGEIVVGLLAGPAAIALAGREWFDLLLPARVLDGLGVIAEAGLVFFLVGLAHTLHGGDQGGRPGRTTAWISAGSFVLPLLTGLLLAGWIVARGDPAVRGTAPLPAFFLMLAVAMSITAVPVLARILAERGMSGTAAGGLALASAITIDALGWLGLTAALGLSAGDVAGALRAAAALALGGASALAVRYGMRTRPGRLLPSRTPRTAALLLGAVALLVSFGMEHLGMTAVLGAAMVGFAIPRDKPAPWAGAAASVGRAGRVLAPAFFVVTGITVLDEALTAVPWTLILAAVLLGCLGKGAGGYFGARLGGCSRAESRQIGVLMNSRGLTELIVLQAGLNAGLLTEPLVLALIVMAVTTTVMTGPLLLLLDRTAAPASRRVPVPTESGV